MKIVDPHQLPHPTTYYNINDPVYKQNTKQLKTSIMDWLLANPQIHSTFASLGTMQNDQYVISENCDSILDEINCKLLIEDHTLRTFRRAIGYGQNIQNDLIPLLLNAKCPKTLDLCIRILVNLTVPVECLVNVDIMKRTETGRHTIYELNNLLITCKMLFTDLRTTKAIMDFMKQVFDKEVKTSIEYCDRINNCLLLLRNILHIPDSNSHKTSMQNQLVWNLFTQSIDKMLLHLMSCTQRSYWGITMVQLIALMYKDQHVNTLQKLLNLWFESSVSDSSEDNESNTTPSKQCSGDSSPMLTSDPTSDSSDNGGSGKCDSNYESMPGSSSNTMSRNDSLETDCVWTKPSSNNSQLNKERSDSLTSSNSSSNRTSENSNESLRSSNDIKCMMRSSISELSDCGYGTQMENQESVSSNEDEILNTKPIHHPPSNQKQRYNLARSNSSASQDKTEWRRKKFVKRSRSNIINMKGLIHYTPTDEDISNLLKEFTVDFLLKGYNNLVHELHVQLLTDVQVQIDTSHFFWLVTYFLKFAAQLELDFEHISFVLSFNVISYLTYEGVSLCEQLELASKHEGTDLKPCLRQMHLVVTAIREFLQAIETYKRSSNLSVEDKEYLKILQYQVASTNDLKCLFLLLLQRYNPALQSKQYLQDLIITNHILLVLLDGVSKHSDFNSKVKMNEHIANFATVEIMYQYGLLLENFIENGEFVNDCIFTMMHHIGGDLGHSSALFQPIILKTYSKIWETEYELCDDWSDLVEFVIHKFINKPQPSQIALPSSTYEMVETVCETTSGDDDNLQINWTQETMDNLYWYYVQSKKADDIVGRIIKSFQDNGNHNIKSRLAVIQQLLQQDIINLVEYDKLMRYEDVHFVRSIQTPTTTVATDPESGIEIKDTDDIQVLLDRLLKENHSEQIVWLQQILIECCFAKLIINGNSVNGVQEIRVMEPIPHHCIVKRQSIPVVPWNAEQTNILNYQPFVLLLHKLGFHLPADAGKLFVRIPDFWTADILYSTALKLGPLDKSTLKFDESQLNVNRSESLEINQPLTVDCGVDNYIQPIESTANSNDCFAIPRTKNANSMIRFTPDPTSMPTVPNWLHIVMKSKNVADHSIHNLLATEDPKPEDETNLLTKPIPSLIYNTQIVDVPQTVIPSTRAIVAKTTTKSASTFDISTITTCNNTINHSKNSLFNMLLKPVMTEQLLSEHTRRRPIASTSLLKIVDDTSTILSNISEELDDGMSSDTTLQNLEDHDVLSICETTSVASGLTRMYVSDEDDRSLHAGLC